MAPVLVGLREGSWSSGSEGVKCPPWRWAWWRGWRPLCWSAWQGAEVKGAEVKRERGQGADVEGRRPRSQCRGAKVEG